jgi:hypothetical protein
MHSADTTEWIWEDFYSPECNALTDQIEVVQSVQPLINGIIDNFLASVLLCRPHFSDINLNITLPV